MTNDDNHNDNALECPLEYSLPWRLECIATYEHDWQMVVVNYSMLVISLIPFFLALEDPSPSPNRNRNRNRAIMRGGCLLIFYVFFQFGLCLSLGCAGISVVWCACLGSALLPTMVLIPTARRHRRLPGTAEREGRGVAAHAETMWRTRAATMVGGELVGFSLLVYYAVTLPWITTVAHVCALGLGMVAEKVTRGRTKPEYNEIENSNTSKCWTNDRLTQFRMKHSTWALYFLAFSCAISLYYQQAISLYYQQKGVPPVKELGRSKAKAEVMNGGESGILSMSKALECLRRSNPELPDISYPKDALEHYHDIHQQLEEWLQHPDHKPHRAANYGGPWIENRWITHFRRKLESKNNSLSDVFGPYIPIFVPWTDHWVRNKYRYPRKLALAMQGLLREDVLYITVSQNADGFVGRCSEFLDLQKKFPITVLSAGGFGHVPIPLLKQPEEPRKKPPVSERQHLISYVGSAKNAPKNMREEMIQQKNHYYYYGDGWREVMEQSKFSLCPRGYGRTAYHVMEALQMGLIPVQVYLEEDQPWLPYGEIMKNISYAVTNTELPELIRQLSKLPNATIAQMEETIETMREDYFSFKGVLQQIGKFMVNPNSSALVCQAITPDAKSGNSIMKSCGEKRLPHKIKPPRNKVKAG